MNRYQAPWSRHGRASLSSRWVSLWPVAVVAVAATVFAIAVFVLAADLPFDADGQIVLDERLPATWTSLLTPYHQHLNLIPIAIWDRMAVVFGTGSTGPYMVLLLSTHVALAVGTTALLALRLSAAWAFGIGLPLALLGSSHYNFVSPWQILFTITLLAGLVGVWASLDRAAPPAKMAVVAISLVMAVLTSNLGMFLIMAMGLWFVLDGRRAQVATLVPAFLVFLVWYAYFGYQGLTTDGPPFAPSTLLAVVPYAATGLSSAAGGLLGLGPLAGAVAVAVASIRYRPDRPMLAFLAAIVVMFLVAALFRSYGGAEQATTSRYIYLAAYLGAFGLAASGAVPRVRPEIVVSFGLVATVLNVWALLAALPGYRS